MIKLASIYVVLLLFYLIAIGSSHILSEGSYIRVPQDYSTIQEAINNAKSGDTIVVSSGKYKENIVIDEKNDLTITFESGAILYGSILINNSRSIVLKNIIVVGDYYNYAYDYNIKIMHSTNVFLENFSSMVPSNVNGIGLTGGRIFIEKSDKIYLNKVVSVADYDVQMEIRYSNNIYIENSLFKLGTLFATYVFNMTIYSSNISAMQFSGNGLVVKSSSIDDFTLASTIYPLNLYIFNNSIDKLTLAIWSEKINNASIWYNDIGVIYIHKKNDKGTTDRLRGLFSSSEDIEYIYNGNKYRGRLGNYYKFLDKLRANLTTSNIIEIPGAKRDTATILNVSGSFSDENSDGIYDNLRVLLYNKRQGIECGYIIEDVLVKPRNQYILVTQEGTNTIKSTTPYGQNTSTTPPPQEEGRGDFWAYIAIALIIIIILVVVLYMKKR